MNFLNVNSWIKCIFLLLVDMHVWCIQREIHVYTLTKQWSTHFVIIAKSKTLTRDSHNNSQRCSGRQNCCQKSKSGSRGSIFLNSMCDNNRIVSCILITISTPIKGEYWIMPIINWICFKKQIKIYWCLKWWICTKILF